MILKNIKKIIQNNNIYNLLILLNIFLNYDQTIVYKVLLLNWNFLVQI